MELTRPSRDSTAPSRRPVYPHGQFIPTLKNIARDPKLHLETMKYDRIYNILMHKAKEQFCRKQTLTLEGYSLLFMRPCDSRGSDH